MVVALCAALLNKIVTTNGHALSTNAIVGSLAILLGEIQNIDLAIPALVIVGDVVGLRERIAWFEGGPLAGRRLLVARARPGLSAMAAELRALGAEVLEIPEVEAVSLDRGSSIDKALARLHAFRGIIFGCAAGVEAVLSHVPTLDLPVIAVGAAAAQALSRHGIKSVVALRGACQEAVGEQSRLFQEGSFLLVTAEEGRPNLRNELTKIGAEVEAVAAYRYVYRMPTAPLPPIDLVVLPSSSAARTILSGDFGQALLALPMAAIGPQTAAAARQCGAPSVVLAEEDNVASLVSLVRSMMGKF